jgi:predicted ABC-class ATPase
MQKLQEIIKSLDGNPVSNYTRLCRSYEQGDVKYIIKDIYGGQYKYCDVYIEIPITYFLGDYQLTSADFIPAAYFILREFSVCTHIANESMYQSEAKIQKGAFIFCKCGQRVLPNSNISINDDYVKLTLTIKLPFNTSAFGGKIATMTEKQLVNAKNNRQKGIISARALNDLLIKNMPKLVESFITQFNPDDLFASVILYRNQEYIRNYLKQNGYVSFIKNGSILPRSGKTDYTDTRAAIPFISPKTMELLILLPDEEAISGMGVKAGITIITGDAYHGKSTILDAIKEGVYNHVAGDGREYVITDETALSIKAEDGRSIRNTDISFFLSNLPIKGLNPHSFSTDNASGSTSQAAAVSEAVEAGCRLMLFDEDRSANNFMYKDDKMKTIIKNASTYPYIDNAIMFYNDYGISSIIVIGASGEYFRIADQVILVDRFVASEFTDYKKSEPQIYRKYFLRRRRVNFSKLQKICVSRNMEIRDDTTIKNR